MTGSSKATDEGGPPALREWGWTAELSAELEQLEPSMRELVPGRIILEQRGVRGVTTADGLVDARVAGRLRHHSPVEQQPTIGDWVLLKLPRADQQMAQIQHVLPRTSKISRKAAGTRTREQVVAANVDRLFIVMGLDGDFNPRRLQRFLITARAGGSRPIVVLNKADLSDRLEQQLDEVEAARGDAPVLVVSCKTGRGLEELRRYLEPGETVAMVGSSGVGKSTLLNTLSGDELMKTGEVRATDDRGQHTTSHRQLWRLPGGALLIDNPGIRELQPWEAEDQVEESFEDVTELGRDCRFRDCGHGGEPGCEVQRAIDQGTLEPERLRAYRGLQQEAVHLEQRQQALRKAEEKKQLRSIHRAQRKFRPRKIE